MEPDPDQTSRVGSNQVFAENQSSVVKTETSKNTSGICNQVEMPDSSSSTNKSNPVTTASLVSSVCSFTLSATVKACECVCVCVRARASVFSERQQGLPLWLCQFNYCCHLVPSQCLDRMTREKKSHFLSLFKLHHTLWQDHLLTKRHGRLI